PRVRGRVDSVPERWANPSQARHLPNLILVSGINLNTHVSPMNPYEEWMAMAPGYDVPIADYLDPGETKRNSGASYATPLVAATIAYWRGLPGIQWELSDPVNVRSLVMQMHRIMLGRRGAGDFRNIPTLAVPADQGTTEAEWPNRPWGQKVPFLWNGDVEGGNCLVNPSLPNCLDDWHFQDRDPSRLRLQETDPGCSSDSGAIAKRQAGGGACPVVVPPSQGGNNGGSPGSGSGSGPGSGPGFASFISFATGAPSPTCTSGCGTLCTGYFCLPQPTGKPADQWDPRDGLGPGVPPTAGPGTPTAGPVSPTTGPGTPTTGPVIITATGSPAGPDDDLPPLTPLTCTAPETIATVTQTINQAIGTTTICVLRPAPTPPPPATPPPTPKQYLAVIREIDPKFKGGSTLNNCARQNDEFYTIWDFGTQHQTSTYKGDWCDKGHDGITQLAFSPVPGRGVGEYTDGYRVVQKSGGANVHNGRGKHQWCPLDGYFGLVICLGTGFSCEHVWERVYKCEGVWLDD
ncbi:hypothetical protein QBC39DRAFT_242568, partial [Podospora conica]